MLEFPECQALARQLGETIQGKTVGQVVARHTPHGFAFYHGDPDGYSALLAGKRVTGAQAFGGQVEISIGDARVTFSDGVNARFFKPGEKRPAKHQLLIEFTDGSAIVCTVQMYGFMQAFIFDQYDNPYYLIAKEKPSPISDNFDHAYFEKLLEAAKPNLSAKAFLATEQRIPGLGNGVLQDILFTAGVHPKTKLSDLNDEQKDRLFTAVKKTLKEMAEKGGRDTEKDLFGQPGGYHTILSKNTLSKPCPVCGSELQRQAYLGGNIYFCPGCQKEK
jgi:formamidopyrimidine-DNA glycosylase